LTNFNESIFSSQQPKITIPEEAKVVFVADLFAEHYTGGAELTTQALIDECPLPYVKILSRDLNIGLLKDGVDKFWVFGNFAQMNPELIPTIIGNLKYTVLEYDYKFCRYRSPEKHESAAGKPCDCPEQINGKLISAFYYGSRGLWWMSEAQKQKYLTLFPFLSEKDNVVLSSVFSKNTLGTIKLLREQVKKDGIQRKGWIVLGSDSWVKGATAAKKWCEDNGKEHEVVWNVPYEEMLAKMSVAEGFVYLPAGADTCPRMVIEAKLLGCQLHLNDYVQHGKEDWFDTTDTTSIEEYLFAAPGLFWNGVKNMMNYRPSISGYTTVYNGVKQDYPFEECIQSMLQFSNEVCVVDGGSTDGTIQRLLNLMNLEPTDAVMSSLDKGETVSSPDEKILLKVIKRDWNHPRFAVFDGMQKAAARAMCKSTFCWQMDSDEIVHEDDAQKIIDLCSKFPNGVDLISLPVIEYWGGPEKIRADIMPWKWRISRNKPNITHGIPSDLRKYDNEGNLYAAEGTDGCDMIDAVTGERINHVSFYSPEADSARRAAVLGNSQALNDYNTWFNNVVENLPGVFHYSWYDLERKMRLYRDYWTRHWESLSGKNYEDTAQSNMMFDVPWSQVTDEMIKSRATEFKSKLGGWIWHRKWDGTTTTPHLTINRTQPKIMSNRMK
jgi:glycosyltransferase involved in cell wall biosynthesis